MSPICDDATCLDLIIRLGEPVVLVTGSYLGALSHTLTALGRIDREGRVPCAGSSSRIQATGSGSPRRSKAYEIFGEPRSPDLSPAEAGRAVRSERWRDRSDLTGICEADNG